VAIAVTYARVPPGSLYNVDDSGLAGGLGRAVVFLNFPVALIAAPLAAVAAERLGSRRARLAGAAAILACAAVVVPGVVDQADLGVRPVNAIAALGVGLALTLTVAAAARVGAGTTPWRRSDRVRVAFAVLVLVLALPWVLAELGVFIGRLPGLGFVVSDEVWHPPRGVVPERGVHLGHHHGLDGFLLSAAAILVARSLDEVRTRALRTALGFYAALMLSYGLVNFANDIWFEQIVKRGWTDLEIPSALQPSFSAVWLVIVLGMVALRPLLHRSARRHPARPQPVPR
jgi:hypothetical protein